MARLSSVGGPSGASLAAGGRHARDARRLSWPRRRTGEQVADDRHRRSAAQPRAPDRRGGGCGDGGRPAAGVPARRCAARDHASQGTRCGPLKRASTAASDPARRLGMAGSGLTMAAMPANGRRTVVPRWVQLVGLPLDRGRRLAGAVVVNHAVFMFVIAALIAILLNPIVRAFCAMRVPRGLSVLLVYLRAAFVLLGISVILGRSSPTSRRWRSTGSNSEFTSKTPHGVTPAEVKLHRPPALDRHVEPLSGSTCAPRASGCIHDVSSLDLQRYTGPGGVDRPGRS